MGHGGRCAHRQAQAQAAGVPRGPPRAMLVELNLTVLPGFVRDAVTDDGEDLLPRLLLYVLYQLSTLLPPQARRRYFQGLLLVFHPDRLSGVRIAHVLARVLTQLLAESLNQDD